MNTFNSRQNILLLEHGLEALSTTHLQLDIPKIDFSLEINELASKLRSTVIKYYEELGYSFPSKVRKAVYALFVYKMIKVLYSRSKCKAQNLINYINETDDHHYVSIKYKVLYKVGSRMNHLLCHCTISGLCLLKVFDCEYFYSVDIKEFSYILQELVKVNLVNKDYRIHPSYTQIINPILFIDENSSS